MNVTGIPLPEARRECERLRRSTVPAIFEERAREAPSAVALRFKHCGIYRELTWSAYLRKVRLAAAGLLGLAVKPGDRVAIMADPSVEYLAAHLGAALFGAVPYGIYPTSAAKEVAFLLEFGGARVAFAGDQEHLDRLLDAERHAGKPLLDTIVLIDARTQFLYSDERVQSFAAFERASEASGAEALDDAVAAVTPKTPVGLIFTSGTTSDPKAAYYTHAGMMVGLGYGLLEVMPELRERQHRVVTHLPLAHGMGQGLSLFVPLFADVIQHFAERGQSLTSVMREVRPTHLLAVPRIWQKIAADLSVQVEHSGAIRSRLFAWAERLGAARAARLRRGGGGAATGFAARLAHAGIVWPALYKMGLSHVEGCGSGGAPIPGGVVERWQAWGLPLRNIYGSTEGGMMGGPTALWADADAGLLHPYPCRIDSGEDGEILVSGAGTFGGYWKDEAATAECRDASGRVRTGDIATFLPDGSYRIVDRKKDILITSGGKNVAPAAVESALKVSPYVSEAIIFGEGRKYLTALIEANFESLAQWARSNDVTYTGFTSLISHPKVVELMAREVDAANRTLARPEQVKYFRIVPKELDPEEGDTTPTRKVKRGHAYKMFQPLIEEMYEAA